MRREFLSGRAAPAGQAGRRNPVKANGCNAGPGGPAVVSALGLIILISAATRASAYPISVHYTESPMRAGGHSQASACRGWSLVCTSPTASTSAPAFGLPHSVLSRSGIPKRASTQERLELIAVMVTASATAMEGG
jgi:hypothetical protein